MNETEDDEQFEQLKAWLASRNEGNSVIKDIDDEFLRADRKSKRVLLGLPAVSLVGILCVLSAYAHAADANCPWDADCISFTPATQYVGGEPLAASQIASHRIETAKAATGPWAVVTNLAMPATTYQRRPVSGTNYYRVVTVLVSGITSDPSSTANSTAVEPKPEPAALQVAENIGYQLNLGSNNRMYFSRIGTLPLGKECTELNALDKHIVKSRDWAVLDAGRTRPRQVFARCSRSG